MDTRKQMSARTCVFAQLRGPRGYHPADMPALRSLAAPLCMLLLAACVQPPSEPAADELVPQPTAIEQRLHNQVDILFVIDDSPGMRPKQDELKARFSQFVG